MLGDRSGGYRLGDASLVDWGWERRHWSARVMSTSSLSWCKIALIRRSYSFDNVSAFLPFVRESVKVCML
jgi:hypothetical protein